jgi:hypothetical protein
MLVERHRGHALETDDVLKLRELTGVKDELQRLADAGGHARLVLPLARFIALHDAVDEWVCTRTGRDWLREADKESLPLVGAMLGSMTTLRADALMAVLSASETASG